MSRFLLVATLAFALLSSACRTTMSVEEAKKVTASYADASFVPPPRTINDITAILDQQKLVDLAAAATARARADQAPPDTANPETLAEFYFQRGLAARAIGRARQEMNDLAKALEWAERGGSGGAGQQYSYRVALELGRAELNGGRLSSAVAHLHQAIAATSRGHWGVWVELHGLLTRVHALAGEVEKAEAAVRQVHAILQESRSRSNLRSEWVAVWNAWGAEGEARLAEAKGELAEAEAFYREGLAGLRQDPIASTYQFVEYLGAQLSALLVRQGRLLEAENEARRALLGALRKYGRYSTFTALILRQLVNVIAEQGRYAEAETLARARIDIYEKTGASSDSLGLGFARAQLGATLVAQSRWREALAEYEIVRHTLADDPEAYQKYLATDLNWALALVETGKPDEALAILRAALARTKLLVGEKGSGTAEVHGLLGMAYAARGDRGRALREFQEATPTLLTRSADMEEEHTSQPARDQRLNVILIAYIGLLANIKGTELERQAGVDAAAEAFRLADIARGQIVQRALDAGAARAAARTPALADLVRREQDAKKQVSALAGTLANALSVPTQEQDPKVVANLRAQIDALRRARQALAEQIEKEFPAYAQLSNPKPGTVEQVRGVLRAGEALIATLITEDRTFVWAIPDRRVVAFAAAPVGPAVLDQSVAGIRQALNPTATMLGDIPAFDLETAHGLYRQLLEPVKAGWEGAQSLLVVPHGALGQLPLALLVTKPVRLGPEEGVLFSNYRGVPWLVRTHAVTVLPSVTALATLRSLPPGDPNRRPFIGFGDPFFSEAQARRAAGPPPATTTALAARGVPVTLRSSPKTQGVDSSQLAMLPRLPETADEIRGVALAMNADLTRDVFIGAQANEKAVKTMSLSGYRVIAFATHGLVPGDLDGLTQPALALSAPGVALVDGDGLLTMEEILGLRLNADWVVLSACNTASGKGAGAEAVSGLGRAFFYAGARALLVSNWPVETNSARELTTDLFRRQSRNPRLTRAKALQETMNALIDGPGFVDGRTNQAVFSYAHPIFWAPFTLVGDGGGSGAPR